MFNYLFTYVYMLTCEVDKEVHKNYLKGSVLHSLLTIRNEPVE